jgi:hypothetical protein
MKKHIYHHNPRHILFICQFPDRPDDYHVLWEGMCYGKHELL